MNPTCVRLTREIRTVSDECSLSLCTLLSRGPPNFSSRNCGPKRTSLLMLESAAMQSRCIHGSITFMSGHGFSCGQMQCHLNSRPISPSDAEAGLFVYAPRVETSFSR